MKEVHTQELEQSDETKKQPWHRVELVKLGKISELVQGGGGKLSLVAGDPGESRKERGTDPGL